jgi:histidinol-phosphate/aromatic aminotransferase/cobyric acid decarboxylase-like protein
MCQQLQGQGVIVRSMAAPWGAPDAFRVTIGTPEQNQQFLETLRRVRTRVPAL